MKICVTGGAGFIGTNLLQALQTKYPDAILVSVDIRQPANPVDTVDYTICDVRDADKLETLLNKCSKIFHLAASIGTHESYDSPSEVFDINIGGTLNVLEYARKHDVEVFVAGMPGVWNNPYSISKDAAVRLVKSYNETYDTMVCSLRWYSVYGPYQYVARYNKAVPTFIHNTLHEQAIPVYGDGEQVADFIYVDDATNLAIAMLEQQRWGDVYQCGSGKGTSVNDLVQKIQTACDIKTDIQHLPMRAGEPVGAKVFADISELQQVFPDFTPTSLTDGLAKTIEHYKQHPAVD